MTSAGRWELFRALGAVADGPADARTACTALGWTGPGNAEHTEVFVLNCPPYASVYLGAEGGLGGDAADRAAGFWRAIGLTPPAEPDHLSALLGLYASLGEAAGAARRDATADALTRARQALFWEHLWPWLPPYLDAVADLGGPGLVPWADLARRALRAERDAHRGGWLPLALRAAPVRGQPATACRPCWTCSRPRSGAVSSSPGGAWRPARTRRAPATGSASGASPCGPCWNRLRPPP